MKKLYLIFLFLFILGCSNTNNPIQIQQVELIPQTVALNFLNTNNNDDKNSSFGKTSLKYKNNRTISNSSLHYLTYISFGDYTIDIVDPSTFKVYICIYNFGKDFEKFKKFSSALSSINIKYKSGVF